MRRTGSLLIGLRSALKPSRISRSLATILVLTFIQAIAGPIANFNTQGANAFTQGSGTSLTQVGGFGGGAFSPIECSQGALTGISTSSTNGDGYYITAFSFTCTALNENATLSSTTEEKNVLGTPNTSDGCPAGQIAYGIQTYLSNNGAGGTYVAGVGLMCGNSMSRGSPTSRTVLPSGLAVVGNPSKTITTSICSAGQFVVGFQGNRGGGIDGLSVRCAAFSGFTYAAVGTPTISNNSYRTATVNFATVNSNNADTALSYTATATPAAGSPVTVSGSGSPLSFDDLLPGMSYTYTVSATNSFGSAPATSSVTSATLALPGSDTDTAFSLSSTGMYAEVADSTGSPFDTTGTFTLEAWVNPSNACPSAGAVISKLSYMLYCNSGLWYFMALADGASGSGISTTISVEQGEWHHLAFTKSSSSGDILFYYDGTLVKTIASGVTSMTPNNHAFQIGRWDNNASYWFQGQIDEVRVFNSQRTQTQVQSDMKTYGPLNDSNLMAYYDFNEGSGATKVYNRKSGATSATDLTVSGSPSWRNIAEESVTATAPYTVVRFLRTYLTANGGWIVPSRVKQFSYLVVAGGGAGGGSMNEGHYSGGGGGGGGVRSGTTNTIHVRLNIKVGMGQISTGCVLGRGDSSTVSGSGLVTIDATGGGSGSCNTSTGDGSGGINGNTGGSGGGGGATYYAMPAGTGNLGGYTPAEGFSGGGGQLNTTDSAYQSAGGGGGAGQAGVTGTSTAAGNGGAGLLSTILDGTNKYYGGGGGGGVRNTPTVGSGGLGGGGTGGATSTRQGTGGEAGTGGGGGGNSKPLGNNGGSGVVIIRWITALQPTYTKPANAYLNLGMTETFTTNVAQDSATAVLTRTFKWESTTLAANGSYTLIKQGVGAANAAFSWVPADTTTSGSGYLYRLTVTDSDTAGLFITDSSTAFAVINRALVVSGSGSFGKRINLAKSETYTITLGTPTYRASLSPIISGITLDTSTAGSAVIKISETMTVGTYYETLTVTDSVSASIITPLTITVTAPPNLLNTGEIVADSLTFHIEPGNSESLIGESGTATNGIVLKDLSGRGAHSTTGAGLNTGAKTTTTCTAPIYSSENAGVLKFDGDTCYYNSYSGSDLEKSYTAEMWFKVDGSIPLYGSFVSQVWPTTSGNISIEIGRMNNSSGGIYVGFFDGTEWHYASCLFIPTVGTWAHIAGTYDGTSMKTYVNGSNTINGSACSVPFTGGFGATKNSQGMIIGKNWTGNNVYSFPFTLGAFRVYNKPLSGDQILQNYNATKNRFLSTNVDLVTPSHKYGNTTTETYTITSGYGADSISFATGNKAGVKLETTTSLVALKTQESLTATTHYETITVTDSLGASTYLPIKMTVSKADTLTISMDTKTVVTFNGAPITSYPKPVIKGLAGLDTFTVTTKFSSSLYTKSSTVPTNADTYTVIAEDPVFGLGALSNYVNVVYETSTAVVNKAKQPSLSVFLYGGTVGQAFPITVLGGAGDGAISETVTAGSTMTGCTITNHSLTATSTNQGFCRIYIVKAASQNYLSESATVDMYFMAYINNQPTGQMGSGATIGLNGINSVETSTVQAPSITGLSTTSISLSGGGTLTITGTGFTGTVTVKFWRNKTINKTSGDSVTISVSAAELSTIGAATGRIAVITSNGEGVSVQTLTVTP